MILNAAPADAQKMQPSYLTTYKRRSAWEDKTKKPSLVQLREYGDITDKDSPIPTVY